MEIETEVYVYSGFHWFIQYEYWVDGCLWVDQKRFDTLWPKKLTT